MVDHTTGVDRDPTTIDRLASQCASTPGRLQDRVAVDARSANSSLNGKWTMRVTDLWPIDNGFMFNWSITFDPSLVDDCNGPIIL